MYFIPVKIYGALDYLFGILLIASPWLFGFSDNNGTLGMESMVPIILGINLFLLALMTNAEWGIAKIISFETHLVVDTVAGLLLAASPWLFNFVTIVYAPHLIIGLGSVFIVAVTQRGPVHRKKRYYLKQKLRERTA